MNTKYIIIVLALGLTACAKKQKAVSLDETVVEQTATTSAPAPAETTKQKSHASHINGTPIYFDYNSAELSDASRAHLKALAEALRNDEDATVTIAGHTDSRGTTEFNLALGERRARSARDYMGRMGFNTSRMELVSYGEERPVATGEDEAAYSQNRRDEFYLNE